MRFNKDVEYALIALAAMSAERRLYSAREIAEAHSVPFGILSKTLQRLASEGILASVQGPRGGYRMDRSPEEVSLDEVMVAVQGQRHVVACLNDSEGCEQEDGCIIKPGIGRMQKLWENLVSSLTLADFSRSRESTGSTLA